MKKYLILALLASAVVVLSGCGMTTSTTSTNQSPGYQLSKSIWKSTDGGQTWQAKNIASARPKTTDWDVLKIVVNPTDSRNVFVGLKSGGMYISNDGGDHWQATNFVSDKVYGLEIDPTDGQTLYVSGVWQNRGKIFKSTDQSKTWKEVFTEAAAGPLVIAMALDKNNPQTVYAATSDNQVMKSVDGGNSWKNIYRDNSPVTNIAIDSKSSDNVYLLDLNGSVFHSNNAGDNFANITPKNLTGFVMGGGWRVLAVDKNVSGGVYLAGNSGIVHSVDAGNSWQKLAALEDPENFPISALSVNPQNSQQIIYGASQAGYSSNDGGGNWTTFQLDSPKTASVITFDPNNSSVIYFGFKK